MTRAGSTNPAGGTAAAPDPVGLPRGFGVEFDADTRELSDGSLFGGSPARVLRLTPAGAAALGELRAGPVRSAAASALARRLTDAGLAHPVPPRHATTPGLADTGQTATSDVTVLIPVRDRAVMLDRCLSAAGSRQPVVVADDGSADPAAIEVVAARHHARVLRRDTSGGPARARNAGLAEVATDIVAFLDSDCVPPPGWTDELVRHFADPLVGAVAPRIVALASASPAGPACSASPRSAAARYAAVCSSLDLGDRPALVRPGSRVSYAPTAALVVRRSALDSLGAGPDVFDPALRYGEDVDLVWRLVSGGWRIRYDPAVCVPHEGPDTWAGLLERRFRYGTSAAPLARRHPDSMAPLVLHPWPAIAVAAVLGGRPVLAAASTAAAWRDITGTVRRAGVPADGAPAAALTGVLQTWLGTGRYATQFATPALALALARPGGTSPVRRLRRRVAAASLLLGPALSDYARRRPELDPVRFGLARIADDVSYGAGVWASCLREGTVLPVRPAISRRPVRITRPASNGKD